MGYLILVGFVALILVSGLISLQPDWTLVNRLTRGAASLGYLAIFLTIISSVTMRQLVRFFGRPFIQLHPVLSATGLILVIFSTNIIILLADVEVQLTAAMGVLGGIAGYLFGTFNMPRSGHGRDRGEDDPGN